MEEIERISNVINSVGPCVGPGKTIPYALATNETSVYRVTGMDQVEDYHKMWLC